MYVVHRVGVRGYTSLILQHVLLEFFPRRRLVCFSKRDIRKVISFYQAWALEVLGRGTGAGSRIMLPVEF